MSGELLSVRLLKPWGHHVAGEAVLVDRMRAVKLEELEIGSIEPPDNTEHFVRGMDLIMDESVAEADAHIRRDLAKALKRAPRDKMVRTSKTKGANQG